MKAYKNESKTQLLRLVFADGDVFHILPGETYQVAKEFERVRGFEVVRTLYVN